MATTRGLTVGVWQTIDATLDNAVSNDIPLSDDDLSYLIDLLMQGVEITRRILASEIRASNRQAQEESLVLAHEALDALAEGAAR